MDDEITYDIADRHGVKKLNRNDGGSFDLICLARALGSVKIYIKKSAHFKDFTVSINIVLLPVFKICAVCTINKIINGG